MDTRPADSLLYWPSIIGPPDTLVEVAHVADPVPALSTLGGAIAWYFLACVALIFAVLTVVDMVRARRGKEVAVGRRLKLRVPWETGDLELKPEPPPRRPAPCPSCGATDRFVPMVQQCSIDVDTLDIKVEHVVGTCAGCKQGLEVSRGRIKLYAGEHPRQDTGNPPPPPNGRAAPEETDSDLPARFRR